MGRYDLRPLRVHQTATQLLAVRGNGAPPWFNIVGRIPPAQTLVRTQPLQHKESVWRSKTKKPSKLFRPTKIVYEEDALRRAFFQDHPWELARPRMVIEDDGRDAEKDDWSKIMQPHKRLSGESVVQRQMWLLHNKPGITPAKAYDQARKEFYDLRLREDVERRVAKEEALATGAYFGKTNLEVGMELEDQEYERWKAWASKEIIFTAQIQASMYTVNNPKERATEESEDRGEEEEEGENVPVAEGKTEAF